LKVTFLFGQILNSNVQLKFTPDIQEQKLVVTT
jgi:hypothetical protein